jgi:hypothetical protein
MKIYSVLDKYLGEGNPVEGRKKMAAANIKRLLSVVDLEAEIIPEKNGDMLTRLIASLKGEELSAEEEAIVFETIGKTTENENRNKAKY